MENLEKEELVKIKGGGVSPWLIAGAVALFTFLAGVFDGFTRPNNCN